MTDALEIQPLPTAVHLPLPLSPGVGDYVVVENMGSVRLTVSALEGSGRRVDASMTVTIEESSDGSSWSTVHAFTLTRSVQSDEVVRDATGPYLRASWSAAGTWGQPRAKAHPFREEAMSGGGASAFVVVDVPASKAFSDFAHGALRVEAQAAGSAGNSIFVNFDVDDLAPSVSAVVVGTTISFTYPTGTLCGEFISYAAATPAIAALVVVTAPDSAAVFTTDFAHEAGFLLQGAEASQYATTSLKTHVANDDGLAVFDNTGEVAIIEATAEAVTFDDSGGGDVMQVSRTPGEGVRFYDTEENVVAAINQDGITVGDVWAGTNPLIKSGDADPSADAGLAAPLSSLYLRTGGAVGEAWMKADTPDTGWERLLTTSDLP